MKAERWHHGWYDAHLAKSSIGSARFRRMAKDEAALVIAELGLRPGDELLDVPCGTGRHAVLFAKAGLKVTGLDLSPACLAEARATCRGQAVKLARADMGNLRKYRGRFDAVVNLFTSFGYFSSDAKNVAALKQLVSTLKPGGGIALQLVDRDWLMGVYRPSAWREERGTLVVEARRYDPKTHYNEEQRVEIDRRTGKARVYYHRIRLYSKREMLALLKAVGLKQVRAAGGPTHPFYLARRSG